MEGRKMEGKKTPRKDRIVRMQVIERRGEGADEELVKLCKYMRVMSDRDTDATVTQVLKTMMIAGRDKAVGGSELAKISGLNRITVIHHLKRLESAGLVKREETKYIMQPKNAEEMLLGFREDMDKMFSEMDELAREIDREFEIMEGKGQHENAQRENKGGIVQAKKKKT